MGQQHAEQFRRGCCGCVAFVGGGYLSACFEASPHQRSTQPLVYVYAVILQVPSSSPSGNVLNFQAPCPVLGTDFLRHTCVYGMRSVAAYPLGAVVSKHISLYKDLGTASRYLADNQLACLVIIVFI